MLKIDIALVQILNTQLNTLYTKNTKYSQLPPLCILSCVNERASYHSASSGLRWAITLELRKIIKTKHIEIIG